MEGGITNYKEVKPRRLKLTRTSYLFGLMVVFASIFSQYFVPFDDFFSRMLMIYGLPVLVISLFYGNNIFKKAAKNNTVAFEYGTAFFGVFSLISTILGLVIINLLENFDPQSLQLLSQPMAGFETLSLDVWFLMAISFLIVGPAEEFIFRGFIFGGLLKLNKKRHWLLLAFVSSLIFAAAHLYYYFALDLASSVVFVEIIAISLALSIAFYASGGNLLIPIFLHGLFNAAGFLDLATGTNLGSGIRSGLVVFGLLMAFYLIVNKARVKLASESGPRLGPCVGENCA